MWLRIAEPVAMRILLLGASGLLSGAATRAFVAAGADVTALSRGQRRLLAGVQPLTADRSDADALRAVLRGRAFDFTVDFLAYDAPHVEALFHEPIAALGRYVMISTGQVYLVTDQPSPPFAEEAADRPLMPEPAEGTRDHAEWSYGMGKRRAEAALMGLRRSHGVRSLALRLPVVQGAEDSSRRLWAYLERMLDGGPVLLPDGGEHRVRFVWAEDVARVLVALAHRSEWPAERALNLAQPDEPSLREFLTTAAEALGLDPRFVAVPSERLAAAGLSAISPYSGRWCSRPDPWRAAAVLGAPCTTSTAYLPDVARAQRAQGGPSHASYALRAQELALARG